MTENIKNWIDENKQQVIEFIQQNQHLLDTFDYKAIEKHPQLSVKPYLRTAIHQLLLDSNWFELLHETALNHVNYLMNDLIAQGNKLGASISLQEVESTDKVFNRDFGWNYSFSWRIDINSPCFKHPEKFSYDITTQEYKYKRYKMPIKTLKWYEVFDYKLDPRPKFQLRRHINIIQSDIDLVVKRANDN